MVISVGYLALQISDNNRLLRSQSHYNALGFGEPLRSYIDERVKQNPAYRGLQAETGAEVTE